MAEKNHPYKVSVCVLTYNQVDSIEKAVDSAIGQVVNFPYEIIIGDDCSTDGTREILRAYEKQYRDLIKLNLQEAHDEEGIAGRRNNMTNIRSAQGKYIAFLDGDDYWISEDKLQKQADFMDAHPNFAMCCTDALDIYEGTKRSSFRSDKIKSMQTSCAFDYRMVVKRELPVVNAGTFYRKSCIVPLPSWFEEVYLADFCLHLVALNKGPGKYFKDIKVAKFWIKDSTVSQYFSGRRWIEVKKNDYAIIAENFSNQQAQPYSYKSLFYVQSAIRYKDKNQFFKMFLAMYKAYQYDATYLVHWFQKRKFRTKSSLKKCIFGFIIRGVRLTYWR